MTRRHKHRGFSLIEALVALLILGMTAVVVLRQGALVATQQSDLDGRSRALWVAESRLSELLSSKTAEAPGVQRSEVSAFGRRWLLTSRIVDTGSFNLRQMSVLVSGEDGRVLAELSAFRRVVP